MTVVLGTVKDGQVCLGADSRASNGYNHVALHDRKVFRVGPLLVGCAGNLRELQILAYHVRLADEDYLSPMSFLITRFIPAFKEALTDTDTGTDISSELLIGYRGLLFHMDSVFAIVQPQRQTMAIGHAADFVTGAFLVYDELREGRDVERSMHEAMQLASLYDSTIGPPYYMERLVCSDISPT